MDLDSDDSSEPLFERFLALIVRVVPLIEQPVQTVVVEALGIAKAETAKELTPSAVFMEAKLYVIFYISANK